MSGLVTHQKKYNPNFNQHLTSHHLILSEPHWLSNHVEMYVNRVDLRKNHTQIYVPIHPRTYQKNLLNLLKSSIPDISRSTVDHYIQHQNSSKIMSIYVMVSIMDFPVFENIQTFLSLQALSCLFPANIFFYLKCCVYPSEKSVCTV